MNIQEILDLLISKVSGFTFQSHFPPHFWAIKDTVHIFPLFTHCQGEGQTLMKAILPANKYLLQLPLGNTRLRSKAHYFCCYWIKAILYQVASNLGNR